MTHRRFDRTARLLGDAGVARLASSTVTVFGIGGVGSFAAEALVRSGVGRVILVDYDRICVTNVNRQLHAQKGTLGKPKVAVMAERLRLINPDATIEERPEFYGPESSARLLVPEPDVVIDAIDNMAAKMHLIATCLRERLRCVSAMGAAARLDPTAVRVADLSETRIDPFARDLRRKHAIDCTRRLGVWAVYSEEAPIPPHELGYDDGAFRCVCPGGDNGVNDCEHRNRVEGSAAFVPAVFGATAASLAVKLLCGLPLPKPLFDVDAPRPRRPTRLDQPSSGQPHSTQPVSGQPVSGQPASGQPASGQPASGQPASGQPSTGQPASGQPASGQPASGQPASRQPPGSQPASAQPPAS